MNPKVLNFPRRAAFDYANLKHGVVGVSNRSNLNGEHVSVDEYLGRGGAVSNATSNPAALSTPLTQYAIGYRDPAMSTLRDTLNRICPLVPAGPSFKYTVYNSKEAFVDYATNGEHKRSIGTEEFARVKSGKTVTDGSVDEKGLTVFIDRRNGAGNNAVRQRYVQNLMDALLRTDLQETILTIEANDTALSSVNFGTANTTANPDVDLMGMIGSSGDARGIDPNLLIFGGGFAQYRKQSILNALRAGSTQGAYMSDAELASFLGVDDIVTLKTRRQSSASAKARLGGANAYALYINPASTLEDASNLKRFYDPEFGADFVVFTEEVATGVLLTVWHANKIICTSTLGIYSLPVTYTA